MFCDKCGTKLSDGTQFCEGCGARASEIGLTSVAEPPPPLFSSTHVNAAPPASPNFIGPYRLVRELGRGGMGVVYLAMRDDGAFRKNVALKVLLKDQVTEEFVLRFKQERQVLAALDHPNIARILDGGDAPDGTPYYVMEYVEGSPLDQYCDQQRLSMTGRLKVFQQVCHAVNYLHQNSILHRDLKPSNILVSPDGVVKLLDFGIAKVVGAAAFSTPELTTALGRPMTPTYASPEQMVGGSPQKASDIYSLGVILYGLLTGRAPYQGMEDKLAKIMSRQDPPPPSANIREELRVTPESTAQLRRAMLGDLDGIVMMAMRFDPKERYKSAADFADDLQRFIDGQAVTAHRGTIAGRSVRMLKRKRAALAVLAAFVVLAAFGGYQWWRSQQQKQEVTHKDEQIRKLLDQLESSSGEGKVEDVLKLQKAIDSSPAVLTENQPLLTRSVRYLDRLSSAQPTPALNLELAGAYQKLGVLQESAASGKVSAQNTYTKAASALVAVTRENPQDTNVRGRIAVLNEKIQALGGSAVAIESPAPPIAAAPSKPAKAIPAPIAVAIPEKPPAAAIEPPPVQAPPETPKISPAERAELEDKLIDVTSKIQIAEQSIEPIRQSLARDGQALTPDIASALARMKPTLDRAKRELAAGNAAGARESLASAEGLAAKVLRAVGR